MATPVEYPFGLSSFLMSKQRTTGAQFLIYEPRSGSGYVKNTSSDTPSFFSVTFKFKEVDAQRFQAWFNGPLQRGRLPFTIPMRTEFGLANQTVQFHAAQGDTILDCSQDGHVYTYSATVVAREIAYPDGIDDNWDYVSSPFWPLTSEWDLALNSITSIEPLLLNGEWLLDGSQTLDGTRN